MERIPNGLLDSSRKHFGREALWHTEGDLCEEILSRPRWFGYALWPGHMPWFVISSRFDVFFNEFDQGVMILNS